MNQRIIISTHLESEIANALTECEHDKIFILVDEVTKEKCLPVIQGFFTLKNAQVIKIGATDTHKNLETIAHVWKSLDMVRRSLRMKPRMRKSMASRI